MLSPTFDNVSGSATFSDMLKGAGLDWEPVPVTVAANAPDFDSVVVPEGTAVGPWILDGQTNIPETLALRRSDTGAVLGRTVSDSYGIVYNRDGADVLRECGLIPDRAWAIDGGRRVIMIARPDHDGDEIVSGDIVRRFVTLSLSHDGSGAVSLAPFTFRLSCMNQLRAGFAEADRKGERFRIRHTLNARDRFARAGAIMADAFRLWDGDVALARSMADLRMPGHMLDAFLSAVVPLVDGASDRVKARVVSIRDDIRARFNGSDACNLPGMSGTVWAALNAATEHVDHADHSHVRGKPGSREREESRFLRAFEGPGAALKANAWQTAVAIVGDA